MEGQSNAAIEAGMLNATKLPSIDTTVRWPVPSNSLKISDYTLKSLRPTAIVGVRV